MNKKEITRNINYGHIHILGASGSGTSTLAKSLCQNLPHKHFDSDDFFWKTKFTNSHSSNIRLKKLQTELYKHKYWILSGAIIDWGNSLMSLFDLVIYISVSNEIRLQRLKTREQNRYGDEILPSGPKYIEHLQFMEWANQYETGGIDVRSRKQQKGWLDNLSCEILEINGDNPVDENEELVLNSILGQTKR